MDVLFFVKLIFFFSCVLAQAIEGEAISCLDLSFKTQHSSANAFEMLLKFKQSRSREAINKHLMRKFDDILTQYCKEVLCCEMFDF